MHSAIKKPDFQRETNEWTHEKIYQLVLSFIEGELIPSIILWKSMSNHIFVIDGSHRISALGVRIKIVQEKLRKFLISFRINIRNGGT